MSALEEFQKSLSVLLESCEKYDRGYDGYDWKTIRGLLAITFHDGAAAADDLAELRKSLAEKDAEIERLREYLKEALDDNYWHAPGCNGVDCVCWVGKSRAALRGEE